MVSVVSVLLIDDDEEDFEITRFLLNDAPGEFEVDWAKDYRSAVELMKDRKYDVCVVDYMIGGETGIEFLRMANKESLKCPMILLTGIGQHDVDMAALEAGASDFLDKNNLTSAVLERAIRYSISHFNVICELEEQSSMLETTLESLGAGIASFNEIGNLVHKNKLFDEIIAESERNSSGVSLIDRNEDERHEYLKNKLAEFKNRIDDEEYIIYDSIGNHYEVRVDPIPGGGDIILLFDITAQKTLQKRSLDAKRQAESAFKMKSAFMAKISHELRTPLNGIFGMLELIRLTKARERQEEYINQIFYSASRLLELVENILDVSVYEKNDEQIEKFGRRET